MDEKKRPAFTVSPLPSDVVWMKASSTDTLLSGRKLMLAEPADYAKAYHALVERGVIDPHGFRITDDALNRIAPVTEQLILSFIAERVLGLPKSY